MSAIFGILRRDGGPVSHDDLEHMANALAHRGPDGRRFVRMGAVGLGHCLMHVNVEDRFEAQPLYDPETDVTLVADCRIDNRQELAGIFGMPPELMSRTPDSTFILRAYQKWGGECAAHLLGDFAFAIWDGRARNLLLARDHMGQRYVHYHCNSRLFFFATEIKALWISSEVPRKLNEDQLGRFLIADLQPRGGATLFRDIFGVPGGTTVEIRPDGKLNRRRYWRSDASAVHSGRDETYYVENYRHLLGEAVTCRISRLIAPPALCFSAGYDSAGIAGVSGSSMTGHGGKLITVSSVLSKDRSDSTRDVRPWVELCRRKMSHLDVRYVVRSPDFSDRQQAAACASADDVPFVFGYVLDDLYGAAERAGARLVMDGIGGDLTINPRGGMALAYFLRQGKFRRFLREFAAGRRPDLTLAQAFRTRVIFPLAPRWARRAWFALRGLGPAELSRFIAPEFLRELRETGAVDLANMPILQTGAHMRESNKSSLRDVAEQPRSYYANEAAAHGLEMTRPMLDMRLVEFGLAVPEDLYVVNGRRRYLARRALADVYPNEYQTRQNYQDAFDPDFGATIRQSSPQIRASLQRLQGDAIVHRYFAVDAMAEVWDEMSAGPNDPATATYALRAFQAAVFAHWLGGQKEIDDPLNAAAQG